MGRENSILAMGLNHHTAPVEVRERLALDTDGVRRHLQILQERGIANEAFLLSTCNRVELYVVPGQQGADGVRSYFRSFRGPKGADIEPFLFHKSGSEAVSHLFRVASSLDSLVVGEPQILGQVKEAVRLASESRSMGRVLGTLTRTTLRVAKRVRTETDIGRFRVGIGNAGVDLALQIFGDLSEHRAMLLGVGEMGTQVAHALKAAGLDELLVANRTYDRAVELSRAQGATALRWENVEEYLARVDIVIAATGATKPIIDYRQVKRALRKRRYRSLLLIDLAVPRNIDPKVDNLDGAFLFNVDDLSQVMEEGKLARHQASQAAEQLVSEEVERFFQSLARAELGPRIGEITRSMEAVRLAELERSRKLLQSLTPEQEKALHQLTKSLVKKVMHRPLQGIHTAARQGDHERLESLIALWQEEK